MARQRWMGASKANVAIFRLGGGMAEWRMVVFTPTPKIPRESSYKNEKNIGNVSLDHARKWSLIIFNWSHICPTYFCLSFGRDTWMQFQAPSSIHCQHIWWIFPVFFWLISTRGLGFAPWTGNNEGSFDPMRWKLKRKMGDLRQKYQGHTVKLMGIMWSATYA